jgi:RNA polymerase sigma factor, sigma-70 family/RNA polymerase sigma-70 factor, sigma-B/F/G subfamily
MNQTIDLIILAQNGDEEAKARVVKENVGLVWSMVHRFKNNFYDKEDLFQIGCIGLMKAINHFDISYNVQFSTYAVPIIMGEIKRYFRDDGSIKVSRSLKELHLKVQKAKEVLLGDLDHEPTLYEIADYLQEDIGNIILAEESSYYPTSLNEQIYEKDGSKISVEDRIEDTKNKLWFEKMALEMEIAKLDEKEKLIIMMRYYYDFNQDSVAKRLGISQVQVSRLEKKIILKLKKRLLEDE